jgi:hypothetical protein
LRGQDAYRNRSNLTVEWVFSDFLLLKQFFYGNGERYKAASNRCRARSAVSLYNITDSNAETDMNVVMNDASAFIEVQGTAEGHAFRQDELNAMLELAKSEQAKALLLQLVCVLCWIVCPAWTQ